jgi:hypothetical protein
VKLVTVKKPVVGPPAEIGKLFGGNLPRFGLQNVAMNFTNVSARGLLESPLLGNFQYDFNESALKRAGIDLNQRISVKATGTSEEVLRAILDQVGVDYRIDGRKVILTPKAGCGGKK